MTVDAGKVLVLAEADYCYGIGTLKIKLERVDRSNPIRYDGDVWFQMQGVQVGSGGTELGPRQVLVVVGGCQRESPYHSSRRPQRRWTVGARGSLVWRPNSLIQPTPPAMELPGRHDQPGEPPRQAPSGHLSSVLRCDEPFRPAAVRAWPGALEPV